MKRASNWRERVCVDSDDAFHTFLESIFSSFSLIAQSYVVHGMKFGHFSLSNKTLYDCVPLEITLENKNPNHSFMCFIS